METDGQHFQFAHKSLGVGQNEREFGQLKGQRKVGTDNVGTDVVGIVLTHQSGGDVDRYDGRGRGVDKLYQRGKSAIQGFAQSRPEQAVNDNVVRGQLRGFIL